MPTWPAQKVSWERRWYWEEKAREVEDGQRLPVDAENWAKEFQMPPFVQPVEDPGAAFERDEHRTDIPLVLAVMWIAWRDRARAGWAWERYCVWGRRLWAEPEGDEQEVSLAEAERELKAALRTGSFTALGRRSHNGPLEPIMADYWPNAEVFHDGLSGMVGPSEDLWDYGDVVVPKAALFDVWLAAAIAESTPATTEPQERAVDDRVTIETAPALVEAEEQVIDDKATSEEMKKLIHAIDEECEGKGQPILPRKQLLAYLRRKLGRSRVGGDSKGGRFRDALSYRKNTAKRGKEKPKSL